MSVRARITPLAVVLGLAVAGPLTLAAPGVATPATPGSPGSPGSPGGPGEAPRAPLHRTAEAAEIPGHYVVVLDRRTGRTERSAATRSVRDLGGRVTAEYGDALDGFAAELPARAVEALRNNPNVRFVESDAKVHAFATQQGAPWGLDRIDQRARPLNGTYRYNRTGAGVTAYIIDTGIRRTHRQLGGRVLAGFTSIKDGRGTNDCAGHGTHVAGTVGAARYGVAKKVTLRPVRVLNCRGSAALSQIIAGIDWVTRHHTGTRPAVANMSLGGETSAALDLAVLGSINDGVTYVLAAGNDNWDACDYSPGRVPAAITVGATNRTDGRSGFSNKGPCVDVFAPGSRITSTWHTSNTATKTIDGTSMAAPHVTGAVALLLQQDPSASPHLVEESLLQATTAGVVGSRGVGSPNRLLYSLGAAILPPAPAEPAPAEQGTTG